MIFQIKKHFITRPIFEKSTWIIIFFPLYLEINIDSISSLSSFYFTTFEKWDTTLRYSNIHYFTILTKNNLGKYFNDSSTKFDNDVIQISGFSQYWLNMMFFSCIIFIDIHIIAIGIIWHTSYTAFLLLSIYSLLSFSSVECDKI